ncbi:MAG: cell wall metabolism sensor histidine kinase WalK [Lachnospiraceae bacterium]|nr:cell wall metabolism sensor histidine kinase WalK [Lachnospiraceae bacterium]
MADKIIKFLKKLRIGRSLKFRLFIIICLMGIIPSIIIRAGILENYEDRAVEVRTSDVQTQLKIIANHLITYNYLQDNSSEVIGAELEQLSNLYNGRMLIINSNLRVVKDTYGISEGKTIISEEVIRCMKGVNTANYDEVNGFIEITIPIIETISAKMAAEDMPEGTEVVRGVMLTSVSTDSIAMTLEILNRKALIIEYIMIFCILAIALLLAQVLIRPFGRVSKSISEIKEGYTDEPISVPDYLETEHIVDAFNGLLKRMKTLDDSRQEFVANVSHELKTPITSVKVLAESLLAQQDVPAELYQEFMKDIAEEIEREDKIINDLLAIVKLDKSVAELNISAVDINELTEIILKRLRPIARKNNVEVLLVSKREVVAEVDEVKMSLILTNLVENAIKYNREQGTVEVTLDADHQFFTIQVSDTGIGIPQECLEQIYERFYRVDKSHSREIGGTGLGLAITRNAVLLHRGSIKVDSKEGEGTTFVVKIPLTRGLTQTKS